LPAVTPRGNGLHVDSGRVRIVSPKSAAQALQLPGARASSHSKAFSMDEADFRESFASSMAAAEAEDSNGVRLGGYIGSPEHMESLMAKMWTSLEGLDNPVGGRPTGAPPPRSPAPTRTPLAAPPDYRPTARTSSLLVTGRQPAHARGAGRTISWGADRMASF
jgi:hypothetical protein